MSTRQQSCSAAVFGPRRGESGFRTSAGSAGVSRNIAAYGPLRQPCATVHILSLVSRFWKLSLYTHLHHHRRLQQARAHYSYCSSKLSTVYARNLRTNILQFQIHLHHRKSVSAHLNFWQWGQGYSVHALASTPNWMMML